MNHFPKLLSSQIGFDVAQTMLEGFDRHYRIFRDAAIHAQDAFRSRRLARPAKARARAASLRTTIACEECVEALEDEYDAENIDDEVWQQIKLHYIGLLTDAPAARVRRDVLQFGVLQDPASLATSTTTSSSCARRSRPSTSRTTSPPRSRPTARTTRQGRPRRDARAHRHQLPAERAVRRPDARRRLRDAGDRRDCSAHSDARRTSRSTCCRRCSSGTRRRISSAGSSTATALLPFALPIAARANRACSGIDTLLLTRDAVADAFSASRTRTSSSTWKCRRRTCSSCARMMPGKPKRGDLHVAGPAEAGQDSVLSRFPASPAHSTDRFSSRPASRAS